ncbi:MAG: murein L,D-transpeptidase family protein [Hyphomicrobiaceae bacterium]
MPPGILSQLRPSIPPEVEKEIEAGVPWSTEIRPDLAPAPRPGQLARLTPPPQPLPWQTPRPNARQRVYTLKARLAEIAPGASIRLAAKFEAAKAAWPPAELALLAIKDEKVLELHARPTGGSWKLIHRYRVLAASGGAGPKLQRGDKQVPEGIYAISFLNPNSAYHVSLRVNFPNAFDRQMAAKDARKDLGGDIMIHGKNLSAGCLAMGDEAVEELFVLAAQTGLGNIKLIIAPTDLREHAGPAVAAGHPLWLPKLYADIATAMADFRQPRSKGLLSFFMQ